MDAKTHPGVAERNNQERQQEKENNLREISKQLQKRWVVNGNAENAAMTFHSLREDNFRQAEAHRDQPRYSRRGVCVQSAFADSWSEQRMHDRHISMDSHDCEEHHVTVKAQEDAPAEQPAGQFPKDPAPDVSHGPGHQREGEDEVGHCEMKEQAVSRADQTHLLQDHPKQKAVSW